MRNSRPELSPKLLTLNPRTPEAVIGCQIVLAECNGEQKSQLILGLIGIGVTVEGYRVIGKL